ncbi:MAG: hypothetical protein ACFNKE_08330, partial [Neisseria elongata]
MLLRPYFDELGLSEGDIPANGGRRPFDADALTLLERFRPPVQASPTAGPVTAPPARTSPTATRPATARSAPRTWPAGPQVRASHQNMLCESRCRFSVL